MTSHRKGQSSYEIAKVVNEGEGPESLLRYYLCGSRGNDGAVLRKPWRVRGPCREDVFLGDYLESLPAGGALWIFSGPGRRRALAAASHEHLGRGVSCRALATPESLWNDERETAFLVRAGSEDGEVRAYAAYQDGMESRGSVIAGRLPEPEQKPDWCPGREHQSGIDSGTQAFAEVSGLSGLFA